jgi:catechol 2,3-dioxygenase-like lactoylglutathione lyase family enzyme
MGGIRRSPHRAGALAVATSAPPSGRTPAIRGALPSVEMITIGSIVIRVDDLERQKAFWTAALDYIPRGPEGGDDAGFALLRPRNGIGPNVSLDRVRSALQIPPRIHLDLYADDQAAEVKRLIGLGATEVHWDRRPPDADYVILADPEGNRFCVIDTTA